jgi:serine/threonine-protein kinase HipA
MNRLAVYLNRERVGTLTDSDEPGFVYDAAWLAQPASIPLSRQLPLREGGFSSQAVRAFFAGLLPEAESRERVASILGTSVENDFALLERIGGECAGAVSLWPDEMAPPPSGRARLRWLDEGELSALVERLPGRPLLAGEKGLRLSLAGAQIKLPIVLAPHTAADAPKVALPLNGTPSTHILKPEPLRFPGLVANEAWCMALARKIGLQAAEAQPVIIGNTPCLIVKRYDRMPSGNGGVLRLHQEDFCQALGVPPSRKYQEEGGPSLRECFALLREWSSAPVLDIRDFLDAVIFAALTGNADAHAKNFSILYADAKRRMTPLYDQVCTLAWPELSKTLSMKIGRAGSLAQVSPEHFKQLSAEANLAWPMVRGRLEELCRITAAAIRRDEIPILSPIPATTTLKRAERMLRLLKQKN